MASVLDIKMKKVADRKLLKFGSPVKVTRAGTSIGSGYGLFTTNSTTLDTAGQFQTALTSKVMTLTAMAKNLEVGDIVTFAKQNYSITAIEVVCPNDLVICYKVEVTYA